MLNHCDADDMAADLQAAAHRLHQTLSVLSVCLGASNKVCRMAEAHVPSCVCWYAQPLYAVKPLHPLPLITPHPTPCATQAALGDLGAGVSELGALMRKVLRDQRCDMQDLRTEVSQ